MAAEAGCVSSQTKPVWMYTPKKSQVQWLGKKGNSLGSLHLASGIDPHRPGVSFPWLSMALVWGHDNIFVKNVEIVLFAVLRVKGTSRFLRGVLV
ncbi:hypothetical protein TNCV_1294611 [Trichonephila clavipes]|nr:hypothetical protein TNCV_1294611 [Trichonephila clavipes]